MWWFLHRIEEMANKRSRTALCDRCGLRYDKELDECPHCYNLGDVNLKAMLEKRSRQTMSIGKIMLYIAFVIIILMLVFRFGYS